jgi:uncharacterized protein YciW
MTKISSEIANDQQYEPRDAFEADVRRMLKALLPRKKRAELAAALTDILDNEPARRITKAQLDNFVAEGKCQPRLPLSVAKALCQLIGHRSLTRYLNTEEELALIAIGEHARANRKLLTQIATPKVKACRH